MLETLKGQGLGYLRALTTLDLRNNRLSSIPDALDELQKCAGLTHLWLQVRGYVCVCVCVSTLHVHCHTACRILSRAVRRTL